MKRQRKDPPMSSELSLAERRLLAIQSVGQVKRLVAIEKAGGLSRFEQQMLNLAL
jgi:hypothetical protein